ncbi:hypothetical protein HQ520_08290 [bacterium]|nr:hypothetical protein [bacterium]
MSRPFGLGLHPAGGLLVTDPGRGMVHFYDWQRRRYATCGPDRPGGLPSPVDVVALGDGRIVVSDSRLGSLEAFDEKGNWLGRFADRVELGRPSGLAIDRERQEIYVVDVLAHAVVALDLDGGELRRFGGRGKQPGEFNFPTHVEIGQAGQVLLTDAMNFRGQVLTQGGEPLTILGRLGDGPGRFSKPKGIAGDDLGRVYVVEGLYDAVEVFGKEGRLLMHVGRSGQGPGEFWLPADVVCDRVEGLLFVADSYNRRVQVFRILRDGESGPERESEK